MTKYRVYWTEEAKVISTYVGIVEAETPKEADIKVRRGDILDVEDQEFLNELDVVTSVDDIVELRDDEE